MQETLLYALSHALHMRHLQHESPRRKEFDHEHLSACLSRVNAALSDEQALGLSMTELTLKGKAKSTLALHMSFYSSLARVPETCPAPRLCPVKGMLLDSCLLRLLHGMLNRAVVIRTIFHDCLA